MTSGKPGEVGCPSGAGLQRRQPRASQDEGAIQEKEEEEHRWRSEKGESQDHPLKTRDVQTRVPSEPDSLGSAVT